MKSRLVIEFPNDTVRDEFMSWFSDGGGEYSFMESIDWALSTDFSRCFPAWGYKPEDGDPIIDVVQKEEG